MTRLAHRCAAGILLTLALSACAPRLPTPPPTVTDVTVPVQAITDNPAVTASAGLDAAWWHMFGSASLDGVLERAQTSNPDLAEARARIDAAAAQMVVAGAARQPHLDSGGKLTAVQQSDNGDHGVYNGEGYVVGDFAPLTLSYRLDLFGHDAELVASAEARREMARARAAQADLALRAALVKTCVGLDLVHRLVDNQRTLVQLAERRMRVAQAALAAGVAAPASVPSYERAVADARARAAEQSARERALGYALAALLGAGPDATQPCGNGDAVLPATLGVPARIDIDTLAHRPDIAFALWQVRAREHERAAARLAFYPNLDLRALIGLNDIGLGDLLKAGSLTYAIAPALSLPLFDGGLREGTFEAANAEHAAAIHAYNRTVLHAARDVASLLAELDRGFTTLGERARVLEATRSELGAARAAFAAGTEAEQPALDAEVAERTAYGALLAEQLHWIDLLADMATALGGGLPATSELHRG